MRLGLLTIFCLSALSLACDKSPQSTSTPPSNSNANAVKPAEGHHDDDGHDHGDGHDHEGDHDDTDKGGGHAGHGVDVIELGTATIGDLTVRASRDKGEIKAGGDAPIDVWVMTSDGKPAKVMAVRFWIGTEDAKGSIKAKADIEIPAEPHHWHTHGQVPDPIPSGAKLWVEVEKQVGQKVVGSFDLKV